MFTWLATALRLRTFGRREDLDDRAAVLALFGRFTDEVTSGLVIVIMPTLRQRLGLSVTQVGWCFQALFSVAAVVEPLAGAALDVGRRRPWLVWGALGWGLALLVAAGAPSFGWLVAAFAVAGAASGPLAHTADVVLIDGHPSAVERIQGRSTTLDTIGALLAPALVAGAGWTGMDERVLLGLVGAGCLCYAALLAGSTIPGAARGSEPWAERRRRIVANVRRVLHDRRGRRWLVALVLHELVDLPDLFEPVWLREVVGASQTVIALHVAVGYLATLVGLVLLEHWLVRRPAERLLVGCCVATLVLYPAWLFTPGVAARFLLVVPRNVAMAPLWPILRSRALAATPDAAGTASAIGSLTGFVPLATGFGWIAGRVGLTGTMAATVMTAIVALLAVVGDAEGQGRR